MYFDRFRAEEDLQDQKAQQEKLENRYRNNRVRYYPVISS